MGGLFAGQRGKRWAVLPVRPAVHAEKMVDIFLFFLIFGDSLITKGKFGTLINDQLSSVDTVN